MQTQARCHHGIDLRSEVQQLCHGVYDSFKTFKLKHADSAEVSDDTLLKTSASGRNVLEKLVQRQLVLIAQV